MAGTTQHFLDTRAVPAASVKDLSRHLFEERYPSSAFANDRSFEQRLAATKMIVAADEPVPTVLGVLVLSKTSGSQVSSTTAIPAWRKLCACSASCSAMDSAFRQRGAS
jgi:hypothetical protein